MSIDRGRVGWGKLVTCSHPWTPYGVIITASPPRPRLSVRGLVFKAVELHGTMVSGTSMASTRGSLKAWYGGGTTKGEGPARRRLVEPHCVVSGQFRPASSTPHRHRTQLLQIGSVASKGQTNNVDASVPPASATTGNAIRPPGSMNFTNHQRRASHARRSNDGHTVSSAEAPRHDDDHFAGVLPRARGEERLRETRRPGTRRTRSLVHNTSRKGKPKNPGRGRKANRTKWANIPH